MIKPVLLHAIAFLPSYKRLFVKSSDVCGIFTGIAFKIDEIVQAWNEMYDAKKWKYGVPSFRLEPLFRRRVPKLHHILEHLCSTCIDSNSQEIKVY